MTEGLEDLCPLWAHQPCQRGGGSGHLSPRGNLRLGANPHGADERHEPPGRYAARHRYPRAYLGCRVRGREVAGPPKDTPHRDPQSWAQNADRVALNPPSLVFRRGLTPRQQAYAHSGSLAKLQQHSLVMDLD